jgi:GNAT superfamily N-acetyltransferase
VELDASGDLIRMELKIREGTVTLRPVTPADRQLIEEMFRACSSQTLYTRFLSPGLGVPLRYLDRLIAHKPPGVLALVAVAETAAKPRVVSLMNFIETEPGARGEIAIVVIDDYQNRGLGTAMLRVLYELERRRGIEKFIADIDAGNRRVFHLIKRSGLPCTIGIDSGVAHAEVEMKAEIKL